MSEMQSPLARLVLFMVCLSIAGAFLAGLHYLVVDQPQQEAESAQIPDNRNLATMNDKCSMCMNECKIEPRCSWCVGRCAEFCEWIALEDLETYCLQKRPR